MSNWRVVLVDKDDNEYRTLNVDASDAMTACFEAYRTLLNSFIYRQAHSTTNGTLEEVPSHLRVKEVTGTGPCVV